MLAVTCSLSKRGKRHYSTVSADSIVRVAPTSDPRWYAACVHSPCRVIAVSSRSITAMLYGVRAVARIGS